MTDYKQLSRTLARKYGLDEHIFQRQIGAESNFNPHAASGAGARGIAQITGPTAKEWGVNASNPTQSLDAAASHMADYVKKYGSYEAALRAYNAGPGAIQASHNFAETNNYVKKILFNGRDPHKLNAPQSTQAPRDANVALHASQLGASPGTSSATSKAPSVVDIIAQYNAGTQAGNADPLSTDYLAQQQEQTQGMIMSALNRQPSPQASPATPASISLGSVAEQSTESPAHAGAAANALDWAASKIGFKETGTNSGGIASYANKQFGMNQAPWCAMFTSLATTKGGAPPQARTASVAEAIQKAQRGEGYVKGLIPANKVQPGDLITWGTHHIGMVESVQNGKMTIIAGNDSNGVQRRQVTPTKQNMFLRPAYGKGKR